MAQAFAVCGVLAFLASACESATFGGNTAPRRETSGKGGGGIDADDGGGGRDSLDQREDTDQPGRQSRGADDAGADPVTPTLDKPGWADDEAFPDLRTIFDTGGGGSAGGADDTGGPGGPGGGVDTDDDGGGGRLGTVNDTSETGLPSFGEDEDGVFWIPCGGPGKDGEGKGGIRARGAKVRIAGELCPEEKDAKLNILFVVDFSGSMEGNPTEGPNDPSTGGACGRLRAAEALEKKLATDFGKATLRYGMVGFSNNANARIGFTSGDGLKSTFNLATWCGADNPNALTNYRAAFEQARAALAGVDGEKIVYFITDGSPTVGGGFLESHENAGLRAAQELRAAYPDLVLNTIFLGYKNGQARNPQGYLEQLTGDPARVKLVDTAERLVEEIDALDVGADTIKKADVTAKLDGGGDLKTVGIESVKRSKERAGRYVFITKPVTLVGERGRTVQNEVRVEAKTKRGQTLRARALIDYKELD